MKRGKQQQQVDKTKRMMTNQRYNLLFAVTVVAALLLATATFADAPVKLIWQTKVGSSATNAPYYDAAKDWLYVNGATEIAILNASTGAKIKNVSSTGIQGMSNIEFGHNGEFFVAAGASIDCHSATTLQTVWQFATVSPCESTPVYVASKNAVFVGSWTSAFFYAINATNGKLLWNNSQAFRSGYQRARYSEKYDLIIFNTQQEVMALNASTGAKVWGQLTGRGRAIVPGAFSEDHEAIYTGTVGGARNFLFSFATATGKINWRANVDGGVGVSILVHEGLLYFTADSLQGHCYAYSAATGKQIWAVPNCGNMGGLASARLYRDTFLFPNSMGVQAAALNGSGTVWRWNAAKNFIYNFPAPTSDGKLFVSGEGGYVYALQLPTE